MPVDVFLSAGEASGDLQASLLAGEMRKIRPDLSIAAIGGPLLRGQGADIWIDSVASGWASIGHLRAYLMIPALAWTLASVAARLIALRPRLIVCVDFGVFNLRLLQLLRTFGYRGKAMYYFPPGAWLDDERRSRIVARVSSAVTPFAHQADFYERLGLPVVWYGHPLAGTIAPRAERPVADPPRIAVLAGSRAAEVQEHAPVLVRAATLARDEMGASFTVIAASEELERELRALWPAACGGEAAVVRAPVALAVTDADVAWCASGTATLEVLLRGVPQIIFYRVSDALARFARRHHPEMEHRPFGLPNLVAGRRFVPELLQEAFEPQRLVALTRDLLAGAPRAAQLAGYDDVRARLGPPDALARIGAYAAGLLG